MRYNTLPVLIALLTFASCKDTPPAPATAGILDTLAKQIWDRDLSTGRAVSITNEVTRLPDRLFSGSEKDLADDSVFFSDVIRQLGQIDPSKISPTARTDYDLLMWTARMRSEAVRYSGNMFPAVTPYSSQLSNHEAIFRQATFRSASDGTKYLDLLGQYADILEEQLRKLRGMEEKGIRIPKPEIKLTVGLINSMRTTPDKHPYFPDESRLKQLDSTERRQFMEKARTILSGRILPQYDSMVSYLGGPYSDSAREVVGLGQYPGGREYYRYLVRLHTTTDLTPQEIHDMGKVQVEAITRKLDSVRKATGFKGDLKAFYSFLRTDKRFLASTPEEVAERLKAPLRRMDTAIHRLISLRPKANYDVRRLPLALEPAMTFGNYFPPGGDQPLGIYYFNGSKLDKRPLTTAAAIAYHEIIPGHHWQACIQGENKNLSIFRRNQNITAYSEGWGEYASWLGLELGLYDDPYDLCGRMLMDMFISVRLVVDVGMNELGWSREQAMAYMREHVIESDEQIGTESLRYSCDIPGQALAYKVGALKLIAMRHKYEEKLGAKFDLVRFHDLVLRNGNLPLSVLEMTLDRELAN